MNEPVAAITFLNVAELGPSDRFYRETLGLELVEDQGCARVYRVAAGGYVGLVRTKTALQPAAGHGVLVSIVVDDVDAWYDRLRTSPGIEIESAPVMVPGIPVNSFFLRDPAGYRLEIQAFTDPAAAVRFEAP